jgi:hypothetical protein
MISIEQRISAKVKGDSLQDLSEHSRVTFLEGNTVSSVVLLINISSIAEK